jgi:predicted permease
VQVSLALVLLICSGLMIRTFRALMHVNPGFREPAGVQTFGISIPEAQIPEAEEERVTRMEEEISRKIAAIPGVNSVSFSSHLPLTNRHNNDPIFAQDRSYRDGELPPIRHFNFMAPGFLQAMGTPLVAGRDITWTDTYQKIPVALVSENLAREYWRDPSNALGKRIRVVADVRDDGMNQEAPTSVYWPVMMQNYGGQKSMVRRDVYFAIRSPRAGSEAFMKDVWRAVSSVNANLPLADIHTLDYYYTKSMGRTSFTLVMLAVAGGMALLLGGVGIYGVIAYSVSQRRREIGIRMALGAQQQTLTGMFVRHGLALAGIGVACGLVTALVVMRLMSSLLFKVSPLDPVTYIAVSVGVVAVAFFASYFPSRRAATVDPVEALRAE